MIKTVIFDFDGTLVDTMPAGLRAINRLSSEYGYKPVNDITRLRDKNLRRIIKEDLKIKFYQFPGYVFKIKNLINRDVDDSKFFPGILIVLRTLSKKYKVVILTSNSESFVNRKLKKSGIDFLHSVRSDSSIFGKATVINKLLKDLNETIDEAIYIGDEIRDVEACEKIGMRIISVSWGYNSKSSLKKIKPDFLVDDPKEIVKIINSIK